MLFTASLKRRNCCHYQTLKNVSSHRWIKADGTNSERVPNHPTNTQNLSMYSLPHNMSGMYLCLCFNPCLDLLNLVTHVYLLLNEERHPQIRFPEIVRPFFTLGEVFAPWELELHPKTSSLPILSRSFDRDRWLSSQLWRSTGLPRNLGRGNLPCSLIEKHWGLEVEKEGRAVICKEKEVDIYKAKQKAKKEEKQLFAKQTN